jgi:hypothetical protein
MLIGVAFGLLSFIRYLGSLFGLVISLCVAIAQFWPDWTVAFLVLAVFSVGQSLADYFLAPCLVGRRVHRNPVWMMFALFAFGYLFGFVGLLIAGPLAAAIGVLIRFAPAPVPIFALPKRLPICPCAKQHLKASWLRRSASRSPARSPKRICGPVAIWGAAHGVLLAAAEPRGAHAGASNGATRPSKLISCCIATIGATGQQWDLQAVRCFRNHLQFRCSQRR